MVVRDIVVEPRTEENGSGRVKGKRKGYRVRAPIDRLFEEGRIDDRRHKAGQRFMTDYLISLGAGDKSTGCAVGHGGVGPTQGMIEASERYRKASAIIRSECRVQTLRIVIEERSLSDVLKLMHIPEKGPTRNGLVRTLLDGLADLADHYGL